MTTHRHWLLYPSALLIAFILFAANIAWVPVSPTLVRGYYYSIDLLNYVQPRALMGSFVYHILPHRNLTPQEFVWLVQAFKLAWIALLCIQIFRWIDDRVVAAMLCFIFTFTSYTYIDSVVTGFVDMPANFWLLAAACLIIRAPRDDCTATTWRLVLSSICLFVALLIHEKSLFASFVVLFWATTRFGKTAWKLAVPYSIMAAIFLIVAWHRPGGTMVPSDYLTHLLQGPEVIYRYVRYASFSVYGVFTSIGVMWFLYLLLGYYAIKEQENRKARWHYGAFIAIGILANLATLLIACDTQRMISNVWLSFFLLLGDHSALVNRLQRNFRLYLTGFILCGVQFLIPPTFVIAETVTPINCYSKVVFLMFESLPCPLCLDYEYRSATEDPLQCGIGGKP